MPKSSDLYYVLKMTNLVPVMCVCHSCACVCVVENVKEVLKLTLENKNGVVTSGELTVILDGLAVDQEPLHNGNASTATSEYPSPLIISLSSRIECLPGVLK